MHCRRKSGIICVIGIYICAGLFLLNQIGLFQENNEYESLCCIAIVSIISIVNVFCLTDKTSEILCLCSAYFIRIFLVLLDVYGRDYIVLLHSGSDSEGFWTTAVNLYNGIRQPEYTKYPYIIKSFLCIVGENRVLVQYVNVLFWLFTVAVVYKIFKLLEIEGKARLYGILMLCFMPNYLILTSILMRESIITFLNTLAFYLFLCWYKGDNIKKIIMSMVVILMSTLLHSGAIAMGVFFALVFAFYDRKRKKIRITIKTIVILISGMLCLILLVATPLRSVFMSYLPSINSIMDLQYLWHDDGGTDYLRGATTNNIIVFGAFTVLRVIYFYISPVPWEARGVGDIIAFAIDGMVYLLIILYSLISMKKSRDKRSIIRIIYGIVIFIGLSFAWTVSNAGTAMRHRTKLIGVFVILFCYSYMRYNNHCLEE